MEHNIHQVGSNFDSTTASGNTTLIDSTTDNPAAGDGVILRTLGWELDPNNSKIVLSIGGNAMFFCDAGGTDTKFPDAVPLPLYIPAGQTVIVNHSTTSLTTAITWDQV